MTKAECRINDEGRMTNDEGSGEEEVGGGVGWRALPGCGETMMSNMAASVGKEKCPSLYTGRFRGGRAGEEARAWGIAGFAEEGDERFLDFWRRRSAKDIGFMRDA